MMNDQYRGTWAGPARDTAEEALADLNRLSEIIAEHAPDLVDGNRRYIRPVPGGAACNAPSTG